MRTLAIAGRFASFLLYLVSPQYSFAVQIIAGTPEDSLFQQLAAEKNSEKKLHLLMEFENRFPESKSLPDVYLTMIDLYRQKDDRSKIIEYGEKTLKADHNNVTAMMALSRNYAIEKKNLDRAVLLAEQALGLIEAMKAQSTPARFTDAQWKEYLHTTEGAARTILDYAKMVKGQ